MFQHFLNPRREPVVVDERLLDAIAAHPATAAVMAERDDQVLARRRELVANLVEAEREARSELPRLRKVVEAARGVVDLRLTGVRAAEDAVREALLDLRTATGAHDRRMAATRLLLRETADPPISELRSELDAELAQTLATKVLVQEWKGPQNLLTGRHDERDVETNVPAIIRRREAIQGALSGLDELEMAAVPRAEALARIDALRASVPPRTSLNETTWASQAKGGKG